MTPKNFAFTLTQFGYYCYEWACLCPHQDGQLPDGGGGRGVASYSRYHIRRRVWFLARKNCSINAHPIEMKLLACIAISIEECFTVSNSKSYSWKGALFFRSNPVNVLRFLFPPVMHECNKENGVIQLTPLHKCNQWQDSLRTLVQFISLNIHLLCTTPCVGMLHVLFNFIIIFYLKSWLKSPARKWVIWQWSSEKNVTIENMTYKVILER